jgi:hypothetical protein
LPGAACGAPDMSGCDPHVGALLQGGCQDRADKQNAASRPCMHSRSLAHTMCVVLKRAARAYAKAVAVATPTTLVNSSSTRVGRVSTYPGSARFLCACRRAEGVSAKTLRCYLWLLSTKKCKAAPGEAKTWNMQALNSLQLTSMPVPARDLRQGIRKLVVQFLA